MELLQTGSGLSDTRLWLKILKYAIERVLVVSALVLGAFMDHGRDTDSTLKRYLPFVPISVGKIPYRAALRDAVSCLCSHLRRLSLKAGVLFLHA